MKKRFCTLMFLILSITMVISACDEINQIDQSETVVTESQPVTEENTVPTEPSEVLIFESNGDETCYVKEIGNCTDKHILIPEYSTDNELVIGIAENAFQTSNVEGIYIPASITNIHCWAFTFCSKLERIVVDENNPVYYSIDNCLIERETNTLVAGTITSIIPDTVQCIGNGAFNGRTELTSIILPDSITVIDDNAFNNCTNLTSIVMSNNVTKIGMGAFSSCANLTDIDIPDSVISIGWCAFGTLHKEYYSGVLKFENGLLLVDDWVVGYEDGVVSVDLTGINGVADFAFQNAKITSITIPDGVRSIGIGAFHSCINLTNVTIPDSVISIGEDAFSRCTSLKEISIPNGVQSIGNSAFSNCTGLISLEISESVVSIGKGAVAYCEALESITVNENNSVYHSHNNCVIETATNTLVLGCKKSVIPNGVTSIGDNAFEGCKGLFTLIIPKSVTRIGENAFYNWFNYNGYVRYCINYTGTVEEWRDIQIDYSNGDYINAAVINFNYVPEN